MVVEILISKMNFKFQEVNNLIEGIIYGLIGAWFLSLFGIDNIFVEALQPFVNFTVTTSHYYFIFGFVGMIYGIVYYLRNKD